MFSLLFICHQARRIEKTKLEEQRITARRHNNALREEERWSAIDKANQKEAEIMQGVPNWEAGAGVYKNRYMKPMDAPGRFKADLYK